MEVAVPMATWKIMLITLLIAIVIGCVLGIVIGKYLLKKAKSDGKSLLSRKEKIIYTISILVGTACIAVGLFYELPSATGEIVGADGNFEQPSQGEEAVENAVGGDVIQAYGGGGFNVATAKGTMVKVG